MLLNWCWRRFLRVPWMVRGSNQSILKDINLEYSLDGLMLKLKLQYFGHLMWQSYSIEKTLMLGKIEAEREGEDRRWDGWMASLTQWIWVWVNSGSWWWTGRPGVLQSMGLQRAGHDWATELNLLNIIVILLDRPVDKNWDSNKLSNFLLLDEISGIYL